jgi:tetratricopeptide (TPR) repeat protein
MARSSSIVVACIKSNDGERGMAGPNPTTERDLAIGAARLAEHLLNHAELLFRRVLKASPEHPTATRLLGVTLFKMDRREDGIGLLRRAADTDGSSAAWRDLACALQRDGQVQAAGEAYARAGESGPPPPDLAFTGERAVHEFKIVDYPYRSVVRYGAGRPAHPRLAALISAGRERYAALIDDLAPLQADFAEIPLGGAYEDVDPFWLNAWFPPLDAMVLTHMLRSTNPVRFIEVGSGVSTKFARRAVDRYGLRTKLISIDPQPRNEIDRLCDQVLRKPLEACDPAMFDTLGPGDVFFLDSSHRSFQGSDVTVFFLEILPRLQPGVIVQIHDIYLPDDYISGHVRRMWNEQYLLAAALLYGADAFEILFPCWFAGQDMDLARRAAGVLKHGPLENLNLYGASFWLRKT